MELDPTMISAILNIILFIALLLLNKKVRDITKYITLAQNIILLMLRTLVALNNLLSTIREAVVDGKIDQDEAEKIVKMIEEIIIEWVNMSPTTQREPQIKPQVAPPDLIS